MTLALSASVSGSACTYRSPLRLLSALALLALMLIACNTSPKPGSTDRSMTGRDAGLPESLAGVPAFAGRCRSEQARLGGAEGAGAGEREACAGMLARASDPGRRCERASGRERYRP